LAFSWLIFLSAPVFSSLFGFYSCSTTVAGDAAKADINSAESSELLIELFS